MPSWSLPALFFELGLALFVYALGLAAGPAFVASLKGPGRRRVAGVTVVVIAGAAAAVVAAWAMSLTAGQGAGLFTGILTNTPALAGVVESLSSNPSRGDPAEPVVAYSLAYPGSVIASLIVIVVARRIAPRLPDLPQPPTAEGDQHELIISRVVRVSRELDMPTLDAAASGQVLIGRIERNGALFVADPTAVLQPGDLVSVVGPRNEASKRSHPRSARSHPTGCCGTGAGSISGACSSPMPRCRGVASATCNCRRASARSSRGSDEATSTSWDIPTSCSSWATGCAWSLLRSACPS